MVDCCVQESRTQEGKKKNAIYTEGIDILKVMWEVGARGRSFRDSVGSD